MSAPPPSSRSSGERPPSEPSPRRPDQGRVLVVAFLVSALVHAVAVAVYPLLVGPGAFGPVPPAPRGEETPPGIEVVQVVEVAEPEEEVSEPEPPEPDPEPARPVEAEPVPAEGGAAAGDASAEAPLERPARTAAEELRPRAADPRLFSELPEEITRVSPERMAQLRLIWAMESMRDSASAAAAAAAAAMDWTHTDEDGGKWGVSPGKIHLGGLTLPLPFSFGAPYDSDAARRAREDAEIERAAVDGAARATQEERARAIRERKERERKNPPDTTGSGGGTSGGGPGGGG